MTCVCEDQVETADYWMIEVNKVSFGNPFKMTVKFCPVCGRNLEEKAEQEHALN